ncbi:MAG: adenosylmethionine--8-amino-7-oxononanoate transaminase [Pseudomonadota bacterium]
MDGSERRSHAALAEDGATAEKPNWYREGLPHIWLPYAQMKTMTPPIPAVATRGSTLQLDDGRRLVDGVGAWWTAAHGYNHPHLLDAARAQLEPMPHIMLGGLAHEQAYRLAARLAALTPGDLGRAFFSESGSVAVEVALKIAVQYWRNAHGQTRSKFVAFLGGYHGDTFATMAVCDPDEGMHSLFQGSLAPQHILPLPDTPARHDALERLLAEDQSIAGVIVEPLIQGAGGMRMHDVETLRRIRAACDAPTAAGERQGPLLIFDEVFTGFGRTGEMFAADAAGVTPDIMTLGKALSGGVTPLAATLASARVYAAFHDDDPDKALMHGPTYTGHAVGCAVANAGLDLFEREPRLAQIRAIEAQCRAALAPLEALEQVAAVRVRGAVAAIEMAEAFDIEAARAWFIAQGAFIRPLGQVVYITPAYTIEPDELAALTTAMRRFAEERPV